MATKQPEVIEQLIAQIKSEMKKTGANIFMEDPVAAPTGSRVICAPPVLDTDDDWLVFVPQDMDYYCTNALSAAGATHSEEQEHYPDGVVWWLGELNIIVLYDYATFYRWVAATHYAQKMNLQSKEERKEFFGAMIDMRPTLDSLIL